LLASRLISLIGVRFLKYLGRPAAARAVLAVVLVS
jgi:hypothetical protein